MTSYQIHFARLDYPPMVLMIECEQDGEAITHATALLDSKHEHWGVEIWKDTLLLARVARGKPPLRGAA